MVGRIRLALSYPRGNLNNKRGARFGRHFPRMLRTSALDVGPRSRHRTLLPYMLLELLTITHRSFPYSETAQIKLTPGLDHNFSGSWFTDYQRYGEFSVVPAETSVSSMAHSPGTR